MTVGGFDRQNGQKNELLSNFVYEVRSGGLFLNAVDEMNSSNDVCDQLRSV